MTITIKNAMGYENLKGREGEGHRTELKLTKDKDFVLEHINTDLSLYGKKPKVLFGLCF